MSREFHALVLRRSADKKTITRAIEKCRISDLPAGELLVRVHYSSLNWKDGLSCSGNPAVTRRFPHVPGIDASGTVVNSLVPEFKIGDFVVVAGTPLGTTVSGGFGQFISIPASWAVPLPQSLTLRESMVYGTAGLTAALAIHRLQKIGLRPEGGPVVVTGATGGVGCISVAILSKLGYDVTAVTGKLQEKEFLKSIGATTVLGREALGDTASRPLLKEVWAGGVDSVGGLMLSALLKSCKVCGAVAATGLVASSELPITVMPFILRGVNLLGINTEALEMELRAHLWSKLSKEWRPDRLDLIARECGLEKLDLEIDRIIAGLQKGRILLKMSEV